MALQSVISLRLGDNIQYSVMAIAISLGAEAGSPFPSKKTAYLRTWPTEKHSNTLKVRYSALGDA